MSRFQPITRHEPSNLDNNQPLQLVFATISPDAVKPQPASPLGDPHKHRLSILRHSNRCLLHLVIRSPPPHNNASSPCTPAYITLFPMLAQPQLCSTPPATLFLPSTPVTAVLCPWHINIPTQKPCKPTPRALHDDLNSAKSPSLLRHSLLAGSREASQANSTAMPYCITLGQPSLIPCHLLPALCLDLACAASRAQPAPTRLVQDPVFPGPLTASLSLLNQQAPSLSCSKKPLLEIFLFGFGED